MLFWRHVYDIRPLCGNGSSSGAGTVAVPGGNNDAPPKALLDQGALASFGHLTSAAAHITLGCLLVAPTTHCCRLLLWTATRAVKGKNQNDTPQHRSSSRERLQH